MSSTNKTTNLGLNSWIGSDKPRREDFNLDNSIIDTKLGEHLNDTSIHVSETEKEKWSNFCSLTTFYGDGAGLKCGSLISDFDVSWGMIFAVDYPVNLNDFDNISSFNYFGVFSTSGSMMGLKYSDNTLTISQSSIPINDTAYKSFNESGVTYVVISFR